jgi:KICSTOR complex protein ITFG2
VWFGATASKELLLMRSCSGSLILQQDNTVLWNLHINHQLFAVYPFGAANDKIATCAWNGMTYIVDQQRNMVRFRFPERVCTFVAGTCDVQCNAPQTHCLRY